MRCPSLAELPPPPVNKTGWPWTEEPCGISEILPDSHPLPKITVVTPSYNQGQFIEATIRSVLLQGYPDIEYIIVDGLSTDNTVEIVQKYEPWLAHWVSEEDRGQAHAINKGFSHSTGDIHAYLNADDFYEPGALHACVMAFQAGHPWIVGRVRCWQQGQGSWPFPQLPGKSFAKWFLSCPIPQAGCFWSAELHREMGPFREDLNYIIDYEFWLRFRFVKKIKPFFINQPIAVYRLHSQSKTIAQNSEFIREGNPVREQYKRRLSLIQRGWLWVADRHRRARVRASKAVSLLKKRDFPGGIRQAVRAFMVWPLIVMDLHGIYLAIKELIFQKRDGTPTPAVWSEWDD